MGCVVLLLKCNTCKTEDCGCCSRVYFISLMAKQAKHKLLFYMVGVTVDRLEDDLKVCYVVKL
jgi:hypothetical protein